jgi:hypothetical protein
MALHEQITDILAEMGVCSPPAPLIRTVLINNGYFVGHKFRYEGGWATWLAQTGQIEVYDDDGKLLKTVALEATENGSAA